MPETDVTDRAVQDSRPFLDAIAEIETTFATDRATAIKAFPAALALATEQDWALLDYLVEVFTLHPREAALRRLGARWRAGDDAERERMVRLVPDTDPGLHSHDTAALAAILETRAARNNTSAADEFAALHAQLQTAELPRQSIRLWRNPPPRLVAPATRRVDASRLTPAAVRARVAARAKRRPAVIEPAHVTDYVRENLFVDTDAADIAKLRRRLDGLVARGVIGTDTPRGWKPTFAGQQPPRPAELADEIWDYTYCQYVADQYTLGNDKTDSREKSMIWAAERTGLRERSDRRDTSQFASNALDDFDNAMHPVLGWRCVSCFVERSHTDRRPIHTHGNTFRSDDGLCDLCRWDNRHGLPALPAGFAASDLATTYCRFFAEHYPDAAYGLLAEARGRAPEWLTTIIDEFLLEHPDLPGAPQSAAPESGAATAPTRPRRRRERVLPPGLRQARCEGCTEFKPVHDDGFCTTCRVHLGLYIPLPTNRHVAA
ncbi:hypothetical protein ACFWPX_03130 [Nocardia sp. NPDC058518]|uniref:hypothetical protein n=1 Tax=Nocardia sp. NPDC058518 TaxID=3346534 RepID=UPI0036691855